MRAEAGSETMTVRAGVVRVCVRFLSDTRPRRDFERPWELRRDVLMGLILSNRGIERNGNSLPWWRWYGIPKPTLDEAFYAASVYIQKAWWIYRHPNAHRATTRPAVSRAPVPDGTDEAAAGPSSVPSREAMIPLSGACAGLRATRGAAGHSGETQAV
ncbi:MAG: hypothetical protein DSO04_02920, partial [Hadesarchaea archaeon]